MGRGEEEIVNIHCQRNYSKSNRENIDKNCAPNVSPSLSLSLLFDGKNYTIVVRTGVLFLERASFWTAWFPAGFSVESSNISAISGSSTDVDIMAIEYQWT